MTQVGRLFRYISISATATGPLVAISLFILCVAHPGRSDFSNDNAILSLVAELVWKQGTLLPSGWIGNYGDLTMPSGLLVVTPLLAWFPNSNGLHSVSCLFAVVSMLGTFSAFFLRGRVPRLVVLVAATVLASGFSYWFIIMLYLQGYPASCIRESNEHFS